MFPVNWLSNPKWQPFVWSGILVLVLLSFFTPLILITIHLIMVPALVLFMKLDLRRFVLLYSASLFLFFAFTFGYGFVWILGSLFYLAPVIVMGVLYKRKASAQAALTAGTLTLIAELLLFLFMIYMAGYRPIEKLKQVFLANLLTVPEQFRVNLPPESIDLVMQMIPIFLVTFSIYYVFVTHGVTRRLLRNSDTPLPGLPPIREWMMPKTMVWYFLGVLLLSLFVTLKSDPYFMMIVLNLLPLFSLAFAIQFVGLLFYIAHQKKWKRSGVIVLVILLVVITMILSPILYLLSLIGLLDVMFNLRKRWSDES